MFPKLFPVRCEELQLELASSQRGRVGASATTGLTQISTNASSASQNWGTNKGTDIERIMAKIEQDNRILAELDHSRSTTLGKLESSAMYQIFINRFFCFHSNKKLYTYILIFNSRDGSKNKGFYALLLSAL